MKLSSKSVLTFGLLSFAVIGNEYSSPIENVTVYKTELSTLSIQNFSRENVEVDLYGEKFTLTPASGIQFECSSYENIELQVKNNVHDYFEIPCSSRVIFTELFSNQYPKGL